MPTISEFVVIEGSPLIGMKLADVTSKYKVEVLHYHNPTLDYQTRTPYNPETTIKSYYTLKVSGASENVRHLRLDSVKYQ